MDRSGAVMTWAIAIVVIYVLSIGPAAKASQLGFFPDKLGAAIYAPVVLLAKASPPVKSAFIWYVELWIDPVPAYPPTSPPPHR